MSTKIGAIALLGLAALSLPSGAAAYYIERLEAGSPIPAMDMMPAAGAAGEPGGRGLPERPLPPAAGGALVASIPPSPPPGIAGRPGAAPSPAALPAAAAPVKAEGYPAGVTEIGTGVPTAITAMGSGMPLSAAVPAILPAGWDAGVPAALGRRRVSFSAMDSGWVTVLDAVARKADVAAVVDWDRRTARIVRPTPGLGNGLPSGVRARDIARDFAPTPAMSAPPSGQGSIVYRPARTAVTPRTMTAEETARHFGVTPRRFYMWNGCGASAVFRGGTPVYLEDPYVVQEAPAAQPSPAPKAQPSPHPAARPVPAPAQSLLAGRPLPMGPAPADTPDAGTGAPAWTVAPGSLARQLQAWAHAAGYRLVWKSPDDFELAAYAGFRGTVRDALAQLASALARNGYPLRVVVHEGTRVIEVGRE